MTRDERAALVAELAALNAARMIVCDDCGRPADYIGDAQAAAIVARHREILAALCPPEAPGLTPGVMRALAT